MDALALRCFSSLDSYHPSTPPISYFLHLSFIAPAMTQQQLNLSLEALTALLQALTALNLNGTFSFFLPLISHTLAGNVATVSSTALSEGATTTVPSDGVSVSAPSSSEVVPVAPTPPGHSTTTAAPTTGMSATRHCSSAVTQPFFFCSFYYHACTCIVWSQHYCCASHWYVA